MKKIIRAEDIPAQRVEYEEYQCEICDFVTSSLQSAEEHYGKTHAVKDRRNYGGNQLLFFETKEDILAWHDWTDELYDRIDVKGFEPGWYYINACREPCDHGCCTTHIGELTPAAYLIRDLEEQVACLSFQALKLRELLGLPKE